MVAIERKLMVVVAGRTAEFEKAMQSAQKTMKTASKEMISTGKSLTTSVTLPIVALGAVALKSSIDFESAFAGVRKTVDASEEQFAQLSSGIRDMSKEIPMAATEIAKVAESAGQLGIKVPSILGFTRVMSDLGVATNMSADQAATALARLANITQMPQSQFDRLGSTVVALGNNLATTEAEIVEMSLRIAGAGKQVGMTEAQILSFAGALSSVGIEAQAGGSAISKVMVQMQLAVEKGGDSLQDFASVAGMSSADFQKAFRDDAASALLAFIRGLETAQNRGVSAIKVLDDMGITEVRMRDALLRAAGAGDLFAESIQLGTAAWEENVALTNEAGKRYKTTESQLVILKNRLVDQATTLGDELAPAFMDALDAAEPFFLAIEKAAEWFANLDEGTQRNIIGLAGLAAATGPALVVGGKMLDLVRGTRKAYDAIAKAMAAKKAATLALSTATAAATATRTAATAATVTATTATGAATAATTAATVATKSFAGALTFLMGPVGIAVAAFAAIAAAIGISYMNSLAAAKRRTEEVVAQMKEAADEEHRVKVAALDEQERLEREAYDKRRSLLEEEHRARAEAAEKAYQAEKDRISKRISEIDKEHDAAIQAIRDEYGVVERTTESKTDLARQASQAVIDSLDAEAEKAKDVHDERMRQLDAEYKGKLRLLDEETRAQLESLQAEIDDIDEKTKQEDKLERERKDQQRVLDLQARIAQEGDAGRRIELEQDLADLLGEINRRQVLEQRELQKAAIREQMEEVQRAAEARRVQLEDEHEQAKRAEQEALETRLRNIEDLKNAETIALEERIAVIQEERIAKEIAENAKYEASKLSIDGQMEALETSYTVKKERMALELSDAIAHEDAKLQIYEKGLANQRTKLAEHLEETHRMIEEAAAEQVRAEQQLRVDMQQARTDYFYQQGTQDGDIAPNPYGTPGHNAAGTDYWRGGWTWVGEEGPELAHLPRGTKILSNRESMRPPQEANRSVKSVPMAAPSQAALATPNAAGPTFTIDIHDNTIEDGTDLGNRIVGAIRRSGR